MSSAAASPAGAPLITVMRETGALVKITVRRVLFSMASAFPYTDAYATAWAALNSAA